MVRLRLLPFLLALASVFLVQGAWAQMRPRDPDAPSARPRPQSQAIPDQARPVPQPVKVPNVINLPYGRAALILRQRGLVPVANRTEGIVKTQSERAGKLVPRGTRVTLRIVQPQEPSPPSPPSPRPTPPSHRPTPPPPPPVRQVEVPSLRDLTLAKAEQRLAERNLRLGEVVRQGTAEVSPGVIIDQNPRSGTLVKVGSRVRVVVDLRAAPPSPRRRPPSPPPPPPPPSQIWQLVLLICLGVGAAAYLLYKVKTGSKPQPPPPQLRFEAKAGETAQEIVADRAMVETALRFKVVKDEGQQELEARDAIIPEKD